MMFNPLGEIAYTIKNALTKNTELEIAADFAMSLGEIHIRYNYHCSQTNSQLLWDANGGIYRSKRRRDGMPSAGTGPLVPFGTTLLVVLLFEEDCCIE